MRISIKYYVLSIMGVFVLAYSLLHTTNYQLPTVYAGNTCVTQSLNPSVQDGLISSTDITNFGNAEGQCVVGDKAAFAPYKIPSYEDLESLYYTQAKTTTTVQKEDPQATGSISLGGSKDHLYYFTGDLTIDSPSDITGNKTGVIFVYGDLTIGPISSNKLTTTNNSGLVFVVQGDVTVNSSISQIDAVIISSGIIRTAINADGTECTANSVDVGTNALTVNGSLISLDPGSIVFCRTLADNSLPAEKIINQPKYLVILRNLLADTMQKWSEIQ